MLFVLHNRKVMTKLVIGEVRSALLMVGVSPVKYGHKQLNSVGLRTLQSKRWVGGIVRHICTILNSLKQHWPIAPKFGF